MKLKNDNNKTKKVYLENNHKIKLLEHDIDI